jgi:uncharacterized RDD family membrane protein YckC
MVAPITCPTCNQPAGDGRFCRICDRGLVPGQTELKLASIGQRVGTYFLDLLIGIFTLVIGWLIWFAIVAPKGQTPGMSLVKVHCVDETGATASAGKLWLRQLVYQGLVYFLADIITFRLAGVIGYCWAFWDKDRQTLHDKMAGTFVVDGAPETVPAMPSAAWTEPAPPSRQSLALKRRIEELQRMKEDGILTEEEFERKRKEAVDTF